MFIYVYVELRYFWKTRKISQIMFQTSRSTSLGRLIIIADPLLFSSIRFIPAKG